MFVVTLFVVVVVVDIAVSLLFLVVVVVVVAASPMQVCLWQVPWSNEGAASRQPPR